MPVATGRDHQKPGGGGAGVLLLPGDEQAVTHGELTKALVDDEVALGDRPGLVLDPERLEPPAHEAIGEALFRVGEAGPGLAGDEELTRGEPRLQERAGAVADERRHPARLIKRGDEGLQPGVAPKGEHRRLAPGHEQGVVVAWAHALNRRGVL